MVLIVRAMGETSMVEPLLLGTVFVLASLLLWLLADSDDDNGGRRLTPAGACAHPGASSPTLKP